LGWRPPTPCFEAGRYYAYKEVTTWFLQNSRSICNRPCRELLTVKRTYLGRINRRTANYCSIWSPEPNGQSGAANQSALCIIVRRCERLSNYLRGAMRNVCRVGSTIVLIKLPRKPTPNLPGRVAIPGDPRLWSLAPQAPATLQL